MIIKINGRDENVVRQATLQELIISRKLSPENIVVEHNFRIVPQEEWARIVLRANDSIEIVSFEKKKKKWKII